MLTFIWFRYECTYKPSLWAISSHAKGTDDLLFSLVGLNLDVSEWVKLGLMDEAERLDRHWASWTNFTQARVFCIHAPSSFTYLSSPPWQDVCWSLYVGRDFCVAEPTGTKATPMPHIDPEYDEITWFYPPAKIAPQPNNLTKTFEATCRLLVIARLIMDVMWVHCMNPGLHHWPEYYWLLATGWTRLAVAHWFLITWSKTLSMPFLLTFASVVNSELVPD